jgi:phenylalanyl-tRNA synthetase alpha chain
MRVVLGQEQGSEHPLTATTAEAVAAFRELGFSVANGPEVETEFYNFDALNIPADHPARDMWDTFWVKGTAEDGSRRLLRTHTSPVQVRHMLEHGAPIKIVAPGKVYRHEATDTTHEAQFHQIEGLWIGADVSLADLKGVLETFFKKFFGPEAEIRFRPSYFPFVEPGVEIDVKFGGKWLEVMGAGMVHASVLEACKVDPKKYRGFAFGGGLDRFLMIKRGITDVRDVYRPDLRFLARFMS